MTFAERLISARNKAGFSQRQLADLLNISVQTYNGYETKGYEPKYELLLKICHALNVSPNELIGYSGTDKLQKAKLIADSLCITYKQKSNNIVISLLIGEYPEKVDISLTQDEFIILVSNSLAIAEHTILFPKRRIIDDDIHNQLYRLYADILRYGENNVPVFKSTNCRIRNYDMNGIDFADL